MSGYDLHVARPQDCADIERMLSRSFPPQLAGVYAPDLLAASLPAFVRIDPRLLACGTWFVARAASGAVVGCGGWTREQPGTGELAPGLGHMRHFCVDIDHTRRGVGRELGLRTLATARTAGLARLDCAATLSAESFYRALGLHTVERISVPIPVFAQPGQLVEFPALLMRIDL